MTKTKLNGVVHGRTIELECEPGLPDGQMVSVTVEPVDATKSQAAFWENDEAYLRLDEEQIREFEGLIVTKKYAGVEAMNKTTFEKGIEKGLELGRREALREDLLERFGELSPTAEERLQAMSLQEMKSVRGALCTAQSLRDLGLDKK